MCKRIVLNKIFKNLVKNSIFIILLTQNSFAIAFSAHLYILDPDPYLSLQIRIYPVFHNRDPTDLDPHHCRQVPTNLANANLVKPRI